MSGPRGTSAWLVCKCCLLPKNESEFHKDRKKRNGRHSHCKNCKKIGQKYSKKKNKRKETLRKYGMTIEDYERMSAKQQDKCLICDEKDPKKHLSVDHDHNTGKTRGLLCNRCNLVLGYARESPLILRLAAAYLEMFHKRHTENRNEDQKPQVQQREHHLRSAFWKH